MIKDLRDSQNVISNPNSPIENEKLQNELEEEQNRDRIDLDIKSTDIIGMGPN